MTKKEKKLKNSKPSRVVFVLDKSGSMQSKAEDVIGGFNNMLKEQKNLHPDTIVSLVLFDTDYNIVCKNVEIVNVPNLTKETYRPSGMTALIDALGKAIVETKKVSGKDNVLFIIDTDGLENASVEYKKADIKKLVEEQQKAGWEFIFTGAGIDAFGEASGYGIATFGIFTRGDTSAHTHAYYNSVSNAMHTHAINGVVDYKQFENDLNNVSTTVTTTTTTTSVGKPHNH